MFDHEHPNYRTDSDLERERHDEQRARVELYPSSARVTVFGPHPFSVSANPRNASCEKCARLANDPIHNTIQEQAA